MVTLVRGLLQCRDVSVRRPCVSILLLSALAGTASAEPDPEVRAIFDRAQRHYDLGEYEAASAGFREAYRADPRPALLYNIAQASRRAGDCVTAEAMYRSFLREDPDSAYRALAEHHLSAMVRCEREHAEPPRTVTAPTTTVAQRSTRGGGRNFRLAGLATAASGVVALATGSYFAWDASRAAHEVSEGYAAGAQWTDLDAVDARGQRSELAGRALITAGAAAAATGAVLYLVGWRTERVTFQPRRDGAEAAMSWSF